uniref:Transmembrane protein 255B n=1 Tax=Esox lucius TaxID=8010 RepID=A0A3P9APY9_ESOLU
MQQTTDQQQPPPQRTQTPDELGPAVQYAKRRRTALWVTISLLGLSVVALVVGLVSAMRTRNVAVAGYYPGIVLSFGAFLGIVGINLLENRRPMLIAAIIFISLGVIASFFCAIVDGIIASEFIVSTNKHTHTHTDTHAHTYNDAHTQTHTHTYNDTHTHILGITKLNLSPNLQMMVPSSTLKSVQTHTHLLVLMQ